MTSAIFCQFVFRLHPLHLAHPSLRRRPGAPPAGGGPGHRHAAGAAPGQGAATGGPRGAPGIPGGTGKGGEKGGKTLEKPWEEMENHVFLRGLTWFYHVLP